LDAIRNTAGAEATLTKETFHKILFNRAVAADKLGKPDEAIQILNQLIAATPASPTLGQADVLLGQMYAVKSDFKNAADAWKKALTAGATPEADIRDRLGLALVAGKDSAGAVEQFEAEAKLLGGTEKLSRESAETLARAHFTAGQFAAAAGLYEELYHRFRDRPAYAYDCAVAMERDKKLSDAAKWYGVAQKAKDKLPPEYAKAVDANLASAQMQSGAGDLSASYWLDSIASATPDTTFATALTQLRKMAVAGKLNSGSRGKIESAMAAYGNAQPRYYELGAVLLQGLSADSKTSDLRTLAAKLVTEFSANESKLDPKSPGATLAPAVIYFFKGETDRLAGNSGDALVSYETILSAYPYNEWPDAAAYGAAECYVALGDKPTALAKFTEVVKSAAASPASAHWGDLAKKRITELNKGE
jgi:tetratricopeptide (TPR) repeat protein